MTSPDIALLFLIIAEILPLGSGTLTQIDPEPDICEPDTLHDSPRDLAALQL